MACELYPRCHSRNRPGFCYSHSQKLVRFPAGQNERFHPAEPSFHPPAVTAGITHYTLQAKPCAKGRPLWKPLFCLEVGTSHTKVRLHPFPPKRKQAIGQPVPGADLCRLLAYMGAYCIAHINRSNLSLPYVR